MAEDFTNDLTVLRGREARHTRSPLHRHIYANFCQGQLGAFDLTLSFFLTRESEPGILAQEEQAAVTMSPVQFKLFAQLCASLVDGYESAFGPIVVPPGTANPNLASGNMVKLVQEAKAKLEADMRADHPAATASDPSTALLRRAMRQLNAGKKKAKKP